MPINAKKSHLLSFYLTVLLELVYLAFNIVIFFYEAFVLYFVFFL